MAVFLPCRHTRMPTYGFFGTELFGAA